MNEINAADPQGGKADVDVVVSYLNIFINEMNVCFMNERNKQFQKVGKEDNQY